MNHLNRKFQSVMDKAVLPYLVMISMLGLHSGHHQLNYEEIKSVGPICSPADTCSFPREPSEDNLIDMVCECKPSCTRYSTCCFDSPNNVPLADRGETDAQLTYHEDCHYLYGTTSAVFAKTKCKQGWQGDREVKLSCENEVANFADPMLLVPVTNQVSLKTYKNYFCAICNDDAAALVFWEVLIVRYERDPTYNKDMIMQDLRYDNRRDKWGVRVTKRQRVRKDSHGDRMCFVVDENDMIFEPVSIFINVPYELNDKIHSCVRDIISDCHPGWKNQIIREKCHSYMGLIYGTPNASVPMKIYRNVHCAICNFAGRKSNLWCLAEFEGSKDSSDIYDISKPTTGTPTLAFTLFLDVTIGNRDPGGRVNPCKLGELNDPFLKQCRAVFCPKRGYKLKEQKCQRSEPFSNRRYGRK